LDAPAKGIVAQNVDLKTSDGTQLKASYFAASKPGPGVLLLHQANRDRKSWDGVASQLASAGINTLTLDMRGHGESGGKAGDKITDNIDEAFQYLVSQPGVNRDLIGAGGAGWLGVGYSVEFARQHPGEVKSLVLLSGETLQDGLQFLRQASQLPGLFVVADDDEYPPTVEAMELLYITSSSPGKKFVHYSAAQDAPWIWYETSDASKVPAKADQDTRSRAGRYRGICREHRSNPDARRSRPGHAAIDGSPAKRSRGAVVPRNYRKHHRPRPSARRRAEVSSGGLEARPPCLS
jgi:pimeloyl-ACP methyl ester carboxylesterase